MRFSVLFAALALMCSAHASNAPAATSGMPQVPVRSKLEQACIETIITSIDREVQLSQKFADLWKQVSALSSGPGSDPKKAVKDWMTPAQLDQFNMLTAQMRYVQFSRYGEVIKRRKARALLTLIQADEKDDKLYAESIASGNLAGDSATINADIDIKMAAAGYALWSAEITVLSRLQFVHDAQTVAIDSNFLPRLMDAKKGGPNFTTDDLDFLFDDNVTETVPYKIFEGRLDDEIKKGNPNATAIKSYLNSGESK